jgi:MarR family transcriptional regulator, transcriptional regulator for hemolysin
MTWSPKQSVGHLVGRAARLYARKADALLRPLGIAAGYIPIFAALKDGGSLSQSALARIAQIEQPTMAATLSRMERDGLIRREPDPADGRSSLIRLTAEAMARIPRMAELLTNGNDEALAGLDAAQRRALIGMLRTIIANLEEGAKREDGGAAR